MAPDRLRMTSLNDNPVINQNDIKSKPIKVLLLLLFSIVVSSCDVGIHLDSANSFAAIIAVAGEYLLAILSTVLVFTLHLSRSFSVSLVLLSILGMTNAVELPISPYIVLAIGLVLLFSFAVTLKAYKPKVIIDKNVKKVFEKDTGEEIQQQGFKRMVIEIGVGIILLFVEYLFFKR